MIGKQLKRIIRILRRITKAPMDRYSQDALALANVYSVTPEALARPQQHPELVRWDKPQVAHWFVPPFEHPYYGGAMTILRLAAHLRRSSGMHQRLLVCGQIDTAKAKTRYMEAFPDLADCDVWQLDSQALIDSLPFADFSFATLWTTAYTLHGIRNTGLKFYLVQDYEPLFYPAGSTSAQVGLTYQFGFYGIANTISIRESIEQHGMKAMHITPCVDKSVFHAPLTEHRTGQGPCKLFFYGRPGHPRNAFELAAVGLRIAKERLGEKIDIVSAGAAWDPEPYGLTGVVRSLGLLPYQETGELYRSCHLGLIMMMTQHPSYLPFELMACGTLVITNNNPYNHWFLQDNQNCLLAHPSASGIAQRIVDAVTSFDSFQELRQKAVGIIDTHHSSWESQMRLAEEWIKSLAKNE